MQKPLVILLLAAAPLAARAQEKLTPLNVKLGLWESTNTITMSGMPPIPEDTLAKMTPDQRARMEAMMKQRGIGNGQPTTTTVKSCVTKEKLDKDMAFDTHKNCTHDVISSTSTHLEFKMHCVGDKDGMTVDGTMKVDASSSDSAKMSGHMVMTGSGHTMNADFVGSSKYLGSDCGDVK